MKLISKLRVKKLRDLQIDVVFPEDNDVSFYTLHGLEKEKEVLSDIVTYMSDGSTNFLPHFGYYIEGPIGIGKSSLTYAVAKQAYIPIISLEASIFNTMESEEVTKTINLIFKVTKDLNRSYGACVLAFKNIQDISDLVDSSFFYSCLLKNISSTSNVFIFLLTTDASLTKIPAALAESNFFSTGFSLEYPSLESREKIISDIIKRDNLLVDSNVSINRLAKDMLGETPLSIAYIMKESFLYSLRQNHPQIMQSDFSETIMKIMAGEKKVKMTEKERKMVAYHEAGHVIAGYFSNPNYVLRRVEISPRADSLGLTMQDTDETKFSYFKDDIINDVIECLGGFCAEELIYGFHTTCVVSDLCQATGNIVNMVKAYGMGESIGATVVLNGITDSDYIKEITDKEIIKTIENLKTTTTAILSEHRKQLEDLANALLEKEVVLGNEIEEIFNLPSS